ncbi:aromatic ring-hydroxylating dioxygenase subunit alpha [Methylocystis sp. ATCC 49242]|uniref:aromatic ring-hydroxylating oxygenase subunit alpha n=1 Tax=Methylocystis sp. ATCC 49242 TaxID=622637 RepID=UPI0001F8755B|nr:aromatic ring-hydroxylating dioxygenase subunit alpha [Methylocystis sp. ATCC 49242]
MFSSFANVWTIVGLARDLKPGRPLPMRVAGERIVFFRDASGNAAALLDRCPHRGVALSLGRVDRGVIECPFHGWRFDGSGANCGAPFNPDAKRENLGAISLPARESGGLLWLYTGFSPEDEPALSDTFAAPGLALCAQSVLWRAHWTRVMENMLDMPHLPFVHRRTIGAGLRELVEKRMDVYWEDRPYGARVTNAVDSVPRPGALEYRFPNVMELFIDPPGKLFRLMVACVPEDEETTRLILLTMRDFARSPLLHPVFRWMNRRIANEDQTIVESSLPHEVPPPAEEASVRTDAPTLAFRRIYRQRLLGSAATPPPRAAAPGKTPAAP